ncbi:shikimate dehydrogenase [Desulfitispora alkaliphila]|uniref:shikimate dehydrogenase n=1 Tax=Desulfitispora alkaliphila TaxID=622674 RepID=UPI003D1A4F59
MESYINGNTKTCVLIGNPVSHSFSPAMHNRAFQELGLNWVYIPTQVEESNLERAMEGIRSLSIRGANVTIPYKEQVIEHLDQVKGEARLIGAVNTILNIEGKLTGYNTDGQGFLRSLAQEKVDLHGKRAVILGAGGSAKAIAVSLAAAGILKIVFVNRNLQRAEGLSQLIKDNFTCNTSVVSLEDKELLRECLKQADLLINTTPYGMYPRHQVETIVPEEYLDNNLIVVDLIYNPQRTVLLAAAEKKGCKTISGMGMLLYQGALAFELWTGQKAPEGIMKKVLLANMNLQK